MDKKLATGLQVAFGFVLGIVLNALFIWAAFALVGVVPANVFSHGIDAMEVYGMMFIGAVQFIWQLPVILLLRWKGRKSLALGVILAASVTALLNATCWGLLEAGKIKIGG
jgi:hypothetical protein